MFRGPLFALWERGGLLDRQAPILHLEPVSIWWERLEALLAPLELPQSLQSLHRCLQLEQFLADALAASSSPAGGRHADWYRQACSLIDLQLGSTVDWEGIARRLDMSYRHFRRRFQVAGGITPGHYRAMRQIERAQELLHTPELSIKQVADRCGFCSAFHLATRFKHFTGLTPAQFRRRLCLR